MKEFYEQITRDLMASLIKLNENYLDEAMSLRNECENMTHFEIYRVHSTLKRISDSITSLSNSIFFIEKSIEELGNKE